MVHRKLSFVESVKFLNRCYDFPERTSAHCRTTTPTSCHEIRGTKHPVAIGRIVEKILSDKAPKVLSSDVDIPSSFQPDLVRMLIRLEQKIESLSQRVTEIHNMVTLR